uniref:serine/threonine-protein kinase/endoribonuclease IRE1-like n=1 Tax=Styela clava TaxID=7725 RepID=UPI001939D2B8|nr:serine/threonine-protein kinase/endoribonuclease IRE1-like [Styela clava]
MSSQKRKLSDSSTQPFMPSQRIRTLSIEDDMSDVSVVNVFRDFTDRTSGYASATGSIRDSQDEDSPMIVISSDTESDEGNPPVKPKFEKINIRRESRDILIEWKYERTVKHFSGRIYCGDENHEILDDLFETQEPYYKIKSPDPTKYYHVDVRAWNSLGGLLFTITSEKLRICKEIDKNVLLDESRPLRKGYKIYEGYLVGASPKLEKVAIKLVDVMDQDRLHREIENNQKLVCHPNTVLYRKSGKIDGIGGQSVYIVVELCDTETLWELVSKKSLGMDPKDVLKQIMQGLRHIHSNEIAHRDLKPQNILLSQDKKSIKIADFGLSKEIIPNKSKFSKSGREIGTDGWGSPEHYKGNTMSYKSDIYSAGLVFYFTLSDGRHVFGDEEHRWKSMIIDGVVPPLNEINCLNAEMAKDLIKQMISFNADSRPTGDQVLSHPYFWEGNKKLDFLNEVKKYLYSKKADGHREHIKKEIQKKSTIFMHQSIGRQYSKPDWLLIILQRNRSRMTPAALSKLESIANGGSKGITYNLSCPIDLIRFIRNIDEHFQEHKNLATMLKSREDVWNLFYDRFPKLFCVVYNSFSDKMNSASRAIFPRELQSYF